MPSFPVMGIRIKTGSVNIHLKWRSHLLPTNPTWTTYISQWRETVNTKTTLGHAAQASYISRKLYIWSLVACQSYRNLGLCWWESNQRWFLSLWKRGYMHHFVVLRTVKGWLCHHQRGQCYWNSNNSRLFSPSSTSLKHSSTPQCTLHALTLDYMPSFILHSVYGSFYLHPKSPPKKDASVVKKYSCVPDSTTLDVVLTHPSCSLWQTCNRTVMLWESLWIVSTWNMVPSEL